MDEAVHDFEQSAAGLEQLALLLRANQWRQAEDRGLTATQLTILSLLRRRGSLRVQQVARQLGSSQPTASDAIASLVEKGLVSKRSDPGDRRAVLVAPSERGAAVIEAHATVPAALIDALETLDGRERAGFRRTLIKLVRALQEAGAIAPQRLCVTCRYFEPFAHPDAASPHHCGFVDAAFGDAALRVDCGDHVEVEETGRSALWRRFDPPPSAQ